MHVDIMHRLRLHVNAKLDNEHKSESSITSYWSVQLQVWLRREGEIAISDASKTAFHRLWCRPRIAINWTFFILNWLAIFKLQVPNFMLVILVAFTQLEVHQSTCAQKHKYLIRSSQYISYTMVRQHLLFFSVEKFDILSIFTSPCIMVSWNSRFGELDCQNTMNWVHDLDLGCDGYAIW